MLTGGGIKMEEKHILEKFAEVSPGMEIWWDSSPVIFDNWCKKMLDKTAPKMLKL
jgi:hypothetical protein